MVRQEHNEVSWSSAPLDSLLNVDKLVDVWRARGLVVHRVSSRRAAWGPPLPPSLDPSPNGGWRGFGIASGC